MIGMGVCKEQARACLPVSFYTEFYWSASLQAMANVVKLRAKKDAQLETRVIAHFIDDILRELFPHSAAALLAEVSQ
jgi:thymidylate synthase ThyX